MAGEGPREWAPGKVVWTVIMDSQHGLDTEVFKKEKDAYKFVMDEILTEDKENMEPDDVKDLETLARKERYADAMEFYNDLMGDYGSERRMTYYTISKKMIR